MVDTPDGEVSGGVGRVAKRESRDLTMVVSVSLRSEMGLRIEEAGGALMVLVIVLTTSGA